MRISRFTDLMMFRHRLWSGISTTALLVLCFGVSACSLLGQKSVYDQPAVEQQNTVSTDSAPVEKKPSVAQQLERMDDTQRAMNGALLDIQQRMLTLETTIKKINEGVQAVDPALKNIRDRIHGLSADIGKIKVAIKKKKRAKKASRKHLRRKIRSKRSKHGNSHLNPLPVVDLAETSPEKNLPALDEKNSYTAAYLALKSGRYDEAGAGFEQLVAAFPDGEYADQAYYWLGESYDARQKPELAIKAFQHVVAQFPNSSKHPAAMLRLGRMYQNTGKQKKAVKVLQELIQQHPESPAAERGRALMQVSAARIR